MTYFLKKYRFSDYHNSCSITGGFSPNRYEKYGRWWVVGEHSQISKNMEE